MVFDGIILGLVVGLIKGGFRHGLQAFSQIRLKGGWIFPILFLIQLFIFRFQESNPDFAALSNYLFVAIYIVGMWFLWMNRQYKGFPIILIGVFLNFLVMAVNGGRMPVSLQAASVLDPYYLDMLKNSTVVTKHYLMDASTRLPFLGDIIPLSSPYPRTQAISLGDIIMNVGIFFYIVHLMTAGKKSSGSSDYSENQTTNLGEPQNLS
ncbi:DUF5317 domain-containing protein [Paenibacillus lemnae]|uniref:DUF5317 domain-containing protein n=1 Tax=Paenibacillus lemnae TaxID=1330551 RepID=A0A848M7W4_PAELE|nr:DUF5317 domain-containing protein [Paenibacillus lemnae]NMO96359.1 DUF5317 domain-containing protein [Paenibacillus lemnae]